MLANRSTRPGCVCQSSRCIPGPFPQTWAVRRDSSDISAYSGRGLARRKHPDPGVSARQRAARERQPWMGPALRELPASRPSRRDTARSWRRTSGSRSARRGGVDYRARGSEQVRPASGRRPAGSRKLARARRGTRTPTRLRQENGSTSPRGTERPIFCLPSGLVLDGLGQMGGLDAVATGQVRDGAGDLQHAVIGASGQV